MDRILTETINNSFPPSLSFILPPSIPVWWQASVQVPCHQASFLAAYGMQSFDQIKLFIHQGSESSAFRFQQDPLFVNYYWACLSDVKTFTSINFEYKQFSPVFYTALQTNQFELAYHMVLSQPKLLFTENSLLYYTLEGYQKFKILIEQYPTILTVTDGQRNSLMLFAIKENNVELLQWLFEIGLQFSSSDIARLPLHIAASKNFLKTICFLEKTHPYLFDQKDQEGKTPLHYAAAKGATESVGYLLTGVKELYCQDVKGRTPLHFAAMYNHIKIVNILLHNKRNSINTVDTGNNTALHVAAFKGNEEVVKQLIEAGIDPYLKNHDKMTAIDIAFFSNHSQLIKYFRQNQRYTVSPIVEKKNFTISQWYIYSSIWTAFTPQEKPVSLSKKTTVEKYPRLNDKGKRSVHYYVSSADDVDFISDKWKALGKPINYLEIKDDDENTPLHFSIQSNNQKIALWLIAQGVKYDQANKVGILPLHLAAQRDNDNILKALYKQDKSLLDKVDHQGRSALHHAVDSNAVHNVKFLLSKNINIYLENNQGQTAQQFAIEQKCSFEIVQLLLQHEQLLPLSLKK